MLKRANKDQIDKEIEDFKEPSFKTNFMPELQHLMSNTNEALISLINIKSDLFEKLQLSFLDRVKLFSKFYTDSLQSQNKMKQSIK